MTQNLPHAKLTFPRKVNRCFTQEIIQKLLIRCWLHRISQENILNTPQKQINLRWFKDYKLITCLLTKLHSKIPLLYPVISVDNGEPLLAPVSALELMYLQYVLF